MARRLHVPIEEKTVTIEEAVPVIGSTAGIVTKQTVNKVVGDDSENVSDTVNHLTLINKRLAAVKADGSKAKNFESMGSCSLYVSGKSGP